MTQSSVSVCQLLLSYRDTRWYNNTSRLQWDCWKGSLIETMWCRQQKRQPHKTLLKEDMDDTCHTSHWLPTQHNTTQHMINKCAGTQARENICTCLHVNSEAGWQLHFSFWMHPQLSCIATRQTVLFNIYQRATHCHASKHCELAEFSARFESCNGFVLS